MLEVKTKNENIEFKKVNVIFISIYHVSVCCKKLIIYKSWKYLICIDTSTIRGCLK